MSLTMTPQLTEGTVKVTGTVHGRRVSGVGYVEIVNA
jgi:hypothetical protein